MSSGAGTSIDRARDGTVAAGSETAASVAPASATSVTSAPASTGATALTLDDAQAVAAWCNRYGVTSDQFAEATTLVGLMPAALHFYLTSHGRPTKVVTAEMRASRAPIRPRDRRRKPIVVPVSAVVARSPTDLETLRLERSMLELNVRIAADALHEHPCPATIHAYDQAQELLDATLAKLDLAEVAQRSATAGFTLKDGTT